MRLSARSAAYGDPFRFALAFGFAAAAAAGTKALLLPVVLYVPTCPCPAFIYSNVPGLPVLTLAAGLGVAMVWPQGAAPWILRAWRGLVLGLAGALAAGLVVAATIPFHDAYFATVYRVYALAFLAIVTGAVAGASHFQLRARADSGTDLLALPMLAVLVVSAVALAPGDRLVSLAAIAGLVAGIGAAELVVRGRARLPHVGPVPALAAIVAAAFVIRLAFGLQVLARNGPGMAFAIGSDDGDAYYKLATAFAADPSALGTILREAAFPPLYAVFVGGVFGLTGESIAALILVQAATAAWATYVVYKLATPIAGVASALVAAVLFATAVDLAHSQAMMTAEAILIPLLLTAMWCYARYHSSDRLSFLIVGSIALGAAFVTRNLAGLLVIAVLGWLFVNGRSRPARMVRDVAVVLLVVILFTVPTAVATAASSSGLRVTNQLADTAFNTPVDGVAIDNRFLVARGIHPTSDPVGSLGRALADPLPVANFYATAVVNRLSALFFFASPGSFDPLFIVNPVLYANPFGHLAELLFLAALIGGCVALVVRRPHLRRPEIGLLAAFAILYIAAFTLLFVPSHPFRYRLPVTPILQIAEAGLLVAMARSAVGLWRADRTATRVLSSPARTSASTLK